MVMGMDVLVANSTVTPPMLGPAPTPTTVHMPSLPQDRAHDNHMLVSLR
jgi:hypothetical protein